MGINGIYGGSGYGAFTPDYTASTASRRVEKGECQTCKNRRYVDGSNENDVSFKTPTHIDPNTAASAVMSHERMHVSNAVAEGNQKNKELVSVSVTLHTSICPECGRVYVSGGETNTTIRTENNSSGNKNPYAGQRAAGANFDLFT